jgi:hypothetical protein
MCSRHSTPRAPLMDPAFMVARREVSATAPAGFTVARSRPIAHPQPVSRAMILCNGPQGVMGELTEAKALTDSRASRSTPAADSIYLAGAAAMNRRVSAVAERASAVDTQVADTLEEGTRAEAVTGAITTDPAGGPAHLNR